RREAAHRVRTQRDRRPPARRGRRDDRELARRDEDARVASPPRPHASRQKRSGTRHLRGGPWRCSMSTERERLGPPPVDALSDVAWARVERNVLTRNQGTI